MVVGAPSGTLTFLFTDIEGSMERWERNAAAMAQALARHDALLRDTIERHDGHVFKTIGDAFCAAFSRAECAAEAALEAQAELGRADFSVIGGLRVRMAIHAGTTIERDADYFGPTVNRVARLLAIGHGGQILVSSVAQALMADTLAADAQLLDLGEHALKDIRAAERVFQLSAAGMPAFPPLRTPMGTASNLPFSTTSFIGREDDARRLTSELARSRSVTLVGTGGIGKTRCAVHVAASAAQRFRHGVRFVELASITDAEFVSPAIAAACDVELVNEEPAVDTLVRALQRRNVLIVLDNCEQVVAEAARVVQHILQRCSETTVLATSREPLNLRGESVYRLPSLALPPPDQPLELADASRFDAIALFVNRARDVAPGFALHEGNLSSVAAICRRLDGIALAIELAASRLRTIGIDELHDRLRQRFRLLTGGTRTDLPRQQTMRALVDWSYDLLSDVERAAFRRFCVFPNRFDLDAALAICAGMGGDDGTLDIVESLVDKSLVAVERDESAERPYRLLETLRAYGLEKLEGCGETGAAYSQLSQCCVARARAADSAWATTGSAAWLRGCERDLDDLRAALGWALEQRRAPALGVELAGASRRVWNAAAAAEGRHWMLLAEGMLDEQTMPAQGGRVQLALAQLHVALGQPAAALRAARRAAEGAGRPDPDRFEADMYAGFSLALLGDIPGAKALLEPALRAFEAMSLEHLAAIAAHDLAVAHVYAEEFAAARTLFHDALVRFRRFDDVHGIEAVTTNLCELEFRSGDVAAAIRLMADAFATRTDDAPVLMIANMATYLCALDRFAQARSYARESLARAEASGRDVDVAFSIQHLAAVAALETEGMGTDENARLAGVARLLGFVDAALERLAGAREFAEQREYDRARGALAGRLDHAALERALREGASLDQRHAIDHAKQL